MSGNSNNFSKSLELLFDRPLEPSFMPKGDNNSVFDLPNDYYVDRYKPLSTDLANRFGSDERIPVKKITLPNLDLPLQLDRRASFSLFIPLHRRMAARLIDVFMGMRNLEDFVSASVYCRDRINPYLYNYALSVAILHRPDTKNVRIPSLCEVFPEKYVDSAIFSRAREESSISRPEEREPLEIPRDYTASDLEIEHRVAYFREDIGINLHHWHWHLVYPAETTREIVDKDRRGELFYYMHEQIMARYNFERLCNGLGRTVRLNNFRDPIEEGYFPKLDSLVSSRVWPPRFANSRLKDINREVEQIEFDILDLERWRDRIFAAIHSGVVINENGESTELSESRGIDILGNIIEASILSPNRNLYGDMHNFGHLAIALCHDPDHRNLETFSIMGDTSTAMRDPVFYRWHAFIDDIFQEHKNTLPRYTVNQLSYQGVTVKGIEVNSKGYPKNQLHTFWQQNDVDLSRGLDFSPRGSVLARFTHLQHAPFDYKITVNNSGGNRSGTARIFIAPKFDERGLPFLFRDQKNLFVELDKFTVNLNGKNTVIERKSTQSSVTIPFERTFRNLDSNRPAEGTAALEAFNFCGCGWPQHMLIPKGNAAGYPAQLFVMISNYQDDRIDDGGQNQPCSDAASYCGIKDSKYPDRRSMGFPFDRQPRDGVGTLQDFLTSNMSVQDVTIHFTDRTVAAPEPVRPAATGTASTSTGNRPAPQKASKPGSRPRN